jgi:hypothetical protein
MKLTALFVAAAPALASAFVAPSSSAALRAPAATRARSQGALGMVVIDDLKFDAALVSLETVDRGID